MEEKPLEGVRVVAFTNWFAGPRITKTLAACGAEVIKIEGRSRPDPQRGGGMPQADGKTTFNRSGDFNQYNTGTLSVAINLAKPGGLELAKKFIARADVVVDNFSGTAMKRMGLGYEELKKIKPDIIMLGASMQGHTGPHAGSQGVGFHLNALTGFYQITGWPDREPVGPDGPFPDYIAPRLCLLAITAALDYRRRTGKGQYLDMSQYEGGIFFQIPLVLDYVVNGRIAGRVGNRSAYAAPHGAYRCRGEDRWCAIATNTDEEWRSFGKVTGDPAWTRDKKFASLLARKENEDELERLVEAWTVNQSAEEVMTLMQAAGVGAGVVQTTEDAMEKDPQLKHRKLFRELDHPELGKYRGIVPAFVLSKSSLEVRRAPLLSEHNEYALKELLGLPEEEIAELVIEEVIE